MKRSKTNKFVGSIAHVIQIKSDVEFAVVFVCLWSEFLSGHVLVWPLKVFLLVGAFLGQTAGVFLFFDDEIVLQHLPIARIDIFKSRSLWRSSWKLQLAVYMDLINDTCLLTLSTFASSPKL